MIRLWDYGCKCGKNYRDYPVDAPRIPRTIKCECGKRAGWITARQNQIALSNSTMYGKMDPRFGQVVESYGEKQRLLKEHGMVEGDVEKYDDIQNEVAEQTAKKTERSPNTLVADSIDEIYERIDTDRIDRGATGNLRGRADQDPETGLIDTWAGF